jgi:hypothetical protein
MGSNTAQAVAWKRRRSPPASETSAGSAESDAPRKCPRTDSRASQPAYAQTSLDALADIEQCIHAADASHFIMWKRDHPYEKRQSCSDLVGHIQSAIRLRFVSSAEQPDQQGIPLEVLLGALIVKFDNLKSGEHRNSMSAAIKLLYEWATDEHRLHRMNLLVEVANTNNEEQMPFEHQIDKWVLNDCMPLIAKEVDAKKRALQYVIGRGAEQPASDCLE